MTPEELLEINPNLLKVTAFMKDHPEFPVRFWNNGTVDITIPESTPIAQFTAKFSCPCCHESMEGPGLPADQSDIKGTFRKCNDCGIRYFVHNRVKFGGTSSR